MTPYRVRATGLRKFDEAFPQTRGRRSFGLNPDCCELGLPANTRQTFARSMTRSCTPAAALHKVAKSYSKPKVEHDRDACTAVPQLFRTAQAEDSQWVPSSWVRGNRREFRLRTNEYVSNSKFHALNELFWI